MTPTPRSSATSEPIPPRQGRSRATLERLLCAAEELLAVRAFEEISMNDVATGAGVAVGTIYTRFRTKDDLLTALLERHRARLDADTTELATRLAKRPSLRARLQAFVEHSVDACHGNRGWLRALLLYARQHPGSVPARFFADRRAEDRSLARLIAGNGREILHKDPLEATEFALGLIRAICHEELLFPSDPDHRRPSPSALKRRLLETVHRDLAGRLG